MATSETKVYIDQGLRIIYYFIYTQPCAVVQQIYYIHNAVIGWCVHVTTRQQISYAKTAAIMEGSVSVTQGSNYWKSRAGDRLISTPKAPRPRRQRRRGGWEWGGGIPLPSRSGVCGSVVSSPSKARGRAPTENEFWCILALKYDTWWQQF